MNLQTSLKLIRHAKDEKAAYAALRTAWAVPDISHEAFCNRFALEVARQFTQGQIDYETGDEIMNCFFSLMILPEFLKAEAPVPEPAWSIFLAFDRGEYRDPSHDSPDEKPSEKYTRSMLPGILAQVTQPEDLNQAGVPDSSARASQSESTQ